MAAPIKKTHGVTKLESRRSDRMADTGARLKEEREWLGMTQSELAAITGVSTVTQFKYEAGSTMPNASYLGIFAEEGGDILYVVTGRREIERSILDRNNVTISEDEAELLHNYQNAGERDRDAARRLLYSLAKLQRLNSGTAERCNVHWD